jgi:hypothetical protein
MVKRVILIVSCILMGYMLECFCEIIHSDYLENIYRTPYFAVLITITVFYFTLFSYISAKISFFEDKLKKKFTATRKEIKYSFIELLIYDILSLSLLVLYFSDITDAKFWRIIIMSAINSLFILVIYNLVDLGKAIFSMFEYEGLINEILSKKTQDNQ